MNNLEQLAIKSLLNLAGEEEAITQRNWDQTQNQEEIQSPPPPKTLNQHRKNRHLVPSQKARQKSSIEINQQDEQQSQASQKENSVQQLIDEYMKSIQNTQKQMELIHQSKFDIKSGWLRFSSILLEDNQKNQKRRQLSQLELPIKETQKYVPKNASIRKILNNNNCFLPKLKQTYLK